GGLFGLYWFLFLRSGVRTGDRALTITLDGGETCSAGLSVVRLKRRRLPNVKLTIVGGDALHPHAVSEDRVDFRIPANGRLVLNWE
ncbi:MAG: hypothetical protein M3N34_08435, partial [Pseudomonadota bacterium]|nr:hypothetical protein [Pseudomonadota bacterium]